MALDRLVFLDNARWLVILWVVLFHVSAGLSGYPEFIQDADNSQIFAVHNAYASSVMMSILFYIAGYLAWSSLQRRGTRGFLVEKTRRLGVPWLVGVLLLGPIMPYLAYYSRSFVGLESPSYGEFWRQYMASGLTHWHLPVAFTANPSFHHQHFWFLSVLLLFFAVYAAAVAAHQRIRPGSTPGRDTPTPPDHCTRAFVAAALAAVAVIWPSIALDLPGGVVAFALCLDPAQLGIYGAVFVLGVHAGARRWYVDQRAPGRRTAAVLGAGLLLAAAGAAGVYVTRGTDSALFLPLTIAAWVLLNLLSVLGFTALVRRCADRPSPLHAHLGAHAFNVYLVQYPVVLLFHLLIFTWEASPFAKFVVMALPSLLVSYALSRFLIRPWPKLAVGAALALNLGLAVFGLPRTAFSHLLLERQGAFRQVIPAGISAVPLLPAASGPGLFAGNTAALVWKDSALYHAGTQLRQRDARGHWRRLAPPWQVTGLAGLPGGGLAATGDGQIAELDRQGDLVQVLAEADSLGRPGWLVGDGAGGLFYDRRDAAPGLTHLLASGERRHVAMATLGAGVLAADGRQLFWSSQREPWIHAYAVDSTGSLDAGRPYAEVFLADGRYGQERGRPVSGEVTGMALDHSGRLLVVNRVGLQVFSPAGELLGVQVLPEDAAACVQGRADGAPALFVAGAEQVYLLQP